MNSFIARLNLIEELSNEGLSEKLIESALASEDDSIEFVTVCDNESSLHDALVAMSKVEESD